MRFCFVGLLFFLSLSSNSIFNQTVKPNVILIMADDMGYETIGAYGGTSYETPILDEMAARGIKFQNAISQPLCTPTRVKIMTGQYNYRNYEYFGYLGSEQKSFGNLFSARGYATCIAGKWQLNGLAYQNEITDWEDSTRPHDFGFQEYSLWQLTHPNRKGGRFANPLIEQNGKVLPRDEKTYGPDVFCEFILDFIERKKEEPFFVYYPMVLVHNPFVPTPDSPEWHVDSLRSKQDDTYFADMVAYTDKIVGKIYDKLERLDLIDNTIIIFTGDNGTNRAIYSQTEDGIVRGGKGNTTDAGMHVPLIINWGEKITKPQVYEELVEFSDFYATFEELLNFEQESDGHSFLDLLLGKPAYKGRDYAFVHYDPKWGKNVNKYRNRFVMTKKYKLYQDGSFYNLEQDLLETNPLAIENLSEEEKVVFHNLKNELDLHPEWKE